MRHVRMLGLCLVAVLAVAVVTASSAVAGPQWVKCEKVGPGHNYTGPNCTKAEKAKPKGSGEYELLKAPEIEAKRVGEGKSASVPFSGHNVGSGGVLYANWEFCSNEEETEEIVGRMTRAACAEKTGGGRLKYGPVTVECSSESNVGEAVGKNQVANVHVTFKGCLALGSIPCGNVGPEEIQTETLKGKLGWLNKSAKEVGVLLEPEKKHGAFAEFPCELGLTTVVGVGNKKEGTAWTSSGCAGPCPGTTPEEEKHGGYDGVISPITPVNQMTNEFTQEYKVEEPEGYPHNTPTAFEGKHVDLLETYTFNTEEPELTTMWSPAGEEITNVNTPEEESEIKA